MTLPYVIIVVPCYDEAERLATEKFLEAPALTYRLEFLFVNDGSNDGTLKLLESLREKAPDRVDVLNLQPNGGKAEAVRSGFLYALKKSPDYIGFWDADLATPLAEIPRFCEVLTTHPQVDMVFGARVKLLGRTIVRKLYRHYFGRIFATAVSVMLALPIYDSQCGAKLFRVTPTLERVFANPFLSRWVFDVEIITRFKQYFREAGVETATKIYELPLYEWQDVKGSKVHLKDGFLAYVDLAKIYLTYRKSLALS